MSTLVRCSVYFRTPEGYEKVDERESGDNGEEDDEGRLYPCPEEDTSALQEELGHDSDPEHPDWDIGIRRSANSKVRVFTIPVNESGHDRTN